jgi:hypothetical protein
MLTHVAGLTKIESIEYQHVRACRKDQCVSLEGMWQEFRLLRISQLSHSVLTQVEDVQPLKHLTSSLPLGRTLLGSLQTDYLGLTNYGALGSSLCEQGHALDGVCGTENREDL